jgi:deoxyadenosine/deoxycytidine kinase
MGEKVKTYAVRLDPQVAEFYDQLANSEGIRTSKLFSKILTNDFQSIAVKQQADRIEDLVNRLEKRIDDFEEDNNFSEKYYEDFSSAYMMLLWLLMKNGASKDEIRSMQAKAANYAEQNFSSKES